MAWTPLKDTPLIKLMERLATLQSAVTELIAREKLNDARARIISARGLQQMKVNRKNKLQKEGGEKAHDGTI